MLSGINHDERAHALLSASGSSRWLACPPSARMEDAYENETSAFAAEGTLAHEMAETLLRFKLGHINRKEYDAALREFVKNEHWAEDMAGYVSQYVDYVLENVAEIEAEGGLGETLVEYRADLREYVPEGFGTTDAGLIGVKTLMVGDFKYGKGVKVEADDNPQLKLYALGLYSAFGWLYPDIERVKLVIVQPRLNHISEAYIPIKTLLAWGEWVKGRAALAYEGGGEQKPGSHCRWCKAKATCRALAEESLKAAQREFAAPTLDDAEVIELYAKVEMVEIWAKALKEHVYKRALDGHKWEGYKLVAGKSRRALDETKAPLALEAAGFQPEQYMTVKLKGLTDLTKAVGGEKAFDAVLGDCVTYKEAKPALVSESDKRPEWNPAADDFDDDDEI